MRGNGLPGPLLRAWAMAWELAFSVAALILILTLSLAGWDQLMDATDELGRDPARTRFYGPGAELPPPDLTEFAPEVRLMTNSIGMKFALIPPGAFIMGSPIEEFGRSVDELPHRVRITHPFYLGVHEVTVAEFRRFVTETRYRPCNSAIGPDLFRHLSNSKPAGEDAYSWKNPGFPQRDDHPVVDVSWADAVAFCQWLGQKENQPYRLPTEAEWEYACRAGTTQPYSMGTYGLSNSFPANLSPMAHDQWSRRLSWRDGFKHTAPVGSFPPNRLGICDMHGNVAEYCSDWYDDGYYGKSPGTDPQGPEMGRWRVMRGGAWNTDLALARSGGRSQIAETTGLPFAGFRVVRSYAQQ